MHLNLETDQWFIERMPELELIEPLFEELWTFGYCDVMDDELEQALQRHFLAEFSPEGRPQ